MKLLLLLALVGLAASASLRSKEFKANTPRELQYQYDAQIATGLEEVSNAFSTMRMRFNVLMRTDGSVDSETGAERWQLIFREINVRQRNNATESLPKALLPMEQFRNLENSDLWYQMERTLKKPFAVLIRPKELTIAKVLFSNEEPFWSVNIKKGFLSLLQVNFIPKDASSATIEQGQWTKETVEPTVAANCKTFYSANKIEFHESDSQVFRVDKAIDFNKCLNPIDGTWGLPGIWNGLRHVRMLPNEEQKNLVDVNNMAQYLVDMGGDQMTPTIRKASARTVHIVSPYSDSTHGSEKIFTVQKLRLMTNATTEDAPTIDISGLTEQAEGIRLIYPEESKNVDREALKSKVIELFGKLFSTEEKKIDMKVFDAILRILRFHLKKEEDLNTIAQELAAARSEKQLKTFILDICPQIGSHGSVKFLMKIVKMLTGTATPTDIISAELNIQHISIIFTKLSMMEKVQLKMLKTVFQVLKDEAFQSKLKYDELMPIFANAWLSAGAMVNVYYGKQGGVEPYMHPIKQDADADLVRKYRDAPWEVRQRHAADSEEFRREFITLVKEWLQRRDAGRNLALKVTKNCGLFELYDQLAPIIQKRDTTKVTERVQAVYATQKMLRRNTLSRVTAQDPRSVPQEEKYIRDGSEYSRHFERISSQIQADLVAKFRDVREDPEVRIACYRVLMQCPNVKQTVLNMLVQSILTEPTQQVYSYCVQHMDQIAQNPLPRYTRVSQTVRAVLSMVKRRQPFDLTYSRVFHGQLWDELHQMGLTVETDMIISDKAFTPRWTHIRIEHQSMGVNMPLLEIGIRTQGLQAILQKFMGPRGLISKFRDAVKMRSEIDSEELLKIVPRMLEEVPNMDLTVALMDYDIIYVKNTRNAMAAAMKKSSKALFRTLAGIGKFMQSFDGLFTISSNYELPTPAGTILDFNCLLTLDFQPRLEVTPMERDSEDYKMGASVRTFLPLSIYGFKRIGSNMHVLNHYHQWLTTLDANKNVFYQFSYKVAKVSDKHYIIYKSLAAPSTRAELVEFENTAFSTIAESHFTGGRLSFNSIDKVLKHRKVADQKQVNYYPIFTNIIAPFGYKIQVQGKYYSAKHLYQAPCSLLMGPSEYTIYMVPTQEDSSSRSAVISSKLEIIYPTEESKKLPQIKLQINNVQPNSIDRDPTESEAIKQKLVSATFTPKEESADKITFDCNLRWFLNLPSNYRTTGYQLKAKAQIELPEDLKMKPRSIPLQSEEWFVNRQLRMSIDISDDETEVATIQVTKSTNQEVKKMLVDKELAEKDLKKIFPLLAACLNESQKSIQEEPLSANPLYTPSCVRQFKRFNKLSQSKVQIIKKASWFLSQKSSPMFDQFVQMFDLYLRPYLTSTEIPTTAAENKITIESRPSPVDMRVQHLNISCPTRKNVWTSIQLPSVPFFWAGVDPLTTAAKDYFKGGASKCSLLHSHIRTFDNVIYSIPKSLFKQISENQCPILLAKDCSKESEFQVLTHIQDGKKHITVHFNVDGKPFAVEVSKPISGEQAKSTVKVNGAEVEHSAEPKEETEIMQRTVKSEKGPVTIVISKYQYADTVMYKVKSAAHGLEVLIGGSKLRKVEIRVSPFYHNKMCGLCGDYNSEKFQEFKAPNYHQVLASPKKMVKQYVLPISDSCRAAKESKTEYDSETSSLYLPNNIWYKSFDLPSRRPSCQIIDNKKVKTFKHAEIKLTSPALKQIIQETDCAMKLAVAKIEENRVRVYLLPSQSKVQIQIGSFKQQLSTASPAMNELSGDSLPSDLVADVQANSQVAKFEVRKGENRVTVKITADRRIIIKASQISESEEAICELAHRSQIESSEEGSQAYSQLKKFTNAEESSACKAQLKKKINQCQVSGQKVLPFYRAYDNNRRQVRFLNSEIESRLAEAKAPIVLSVDQIGEETSVAHSVQLVHSREEGKLVRKVLLKKNRQTLVKVTVPEAAQARVTYSKDGSEHTIVPSSSQSIDIDGDFTLTVSGDRVQVVHKKNLYELDVQLSADEPKVSIVRPYAHDSYKRVGLCQVNRLPEDPYYESNIGAVLGSVMESCLKAQDSSAPIFTEEEVARINRLVGSSKVSEYQME